MNSEVADLHSSGEIKIVRLAPELMEPLLRFLGEIESRGEREYFSPHPFDRDTISLLANETNDLYYLLMHHSNVVGYGMLRGWSQGFERPSLGIAIAASYRKLGFARMLMSFLHSAARTRGSKQVRLTVLKGNSAAMNLYDSLGYRFSPMSDDRLEGVVDLVNVSSDGAYV